jgi:3-hydroxymyristoyl/3-hydroxydecanoyl-(acyl carrier protein) dehydratase
MSGQWDLVRQAVCRGGEFSASARADGESPWFAGHFPGEPILPGIALLAIAADTVRQCGLETGRPMVVSGFRKVRFKKVVLPGEEMIVNVKKIDDRSYYFEIATAAKEAVCTGVVSGESAG